MIRYTNPLLVALLVLLYFGHAPAYAENTMTVTPEQKITAHVADLPLGQVLALLAEQVPLDVQGNTATAETVTLHVSGITLQEALNAILTGYNYVLIRPETPGRLILIVLGKAEKSLNDVETKKSEETNTGARNLAVPGEAHVGQSGTASIPSTEIPSPSPATAAFQPVQPVPAVTPATTPPPATAGGPEAAAAQPNPSVDASTSPPATADTQPPFNPAAWGGRGYTGRGRK